MPPCEPGPARPGAGLPGRYGCLPALDAIRALPPAALDALVVRSDRASRPATYWAFFGEAPFGLPALLQVHQLKNRMQPRHVQAFLGQLALSGCDYGVLVTTGACSPEALCLARERRLPRLRVITGPEWVRDLARWRVGVRRAVLAAWVLGAPPDGDAPEPGCR
jgi:hypothetical protein